MLRHGRPPQRLDSLPGRRSSTAITRSQVLQLPRHAGTGASPQGFHCFAAAAGTRPALLENHHVRRGPPATVRMTNGVVLPPPPERDERYRHLRPVAAWLGLLDQLVRDASVAEIESEQERREMTANTASFIAEWLEERASYATALAYAQIAAAVEPSVPWNTYHVGRVSRKADESGMRWPGSAVPRMRPVRARIHTSRWLRWRGSATCTGREADSFVRGAISAVRSSVRAATTSSRSQETCSRTSAS